MDAGLICPELHDDYKLLRIALRKSAMPTERHRERQWPRRPRIAGVHIGSRANAHRNNHGGRKALAQAKGPSMAQDPCHSSLSRRDSPDSILDAVGRMDVGKRILIEGGPRLLGEFYARRLVDEQFLTVAPQIAGREEGDGRLSLVMGQTFPPGGARWGTLSTLAGAATYFCVNVPLHLSAPQNSRRRQTRDSPSHEPRWKKLP